MQQEDWYLKQHLELRERARRFVELSEQWVEQCYSPNTENETKGEFEARDRIANDFWKLVKDLPGNFMRLWLHEELEDIQAFTRFLMRSADPSHKAVPAYELKDLLAIATRASDLTEREQLLLGRVTEDYELGGHE